MFLKIAADYFVRLYLPLFSHGIQARASLRWVKVVPAAPLFLPPTPTRPPLPLEITDYPHTLWCRARSLLFIKTLSKTLPLPLSDHSHCHFLRRCF